MEKIKGLIIKFKEKFFTREIIMYLICGVLATVVNLVTYFSFVNVFKIEENISNVIAIITSILFAYFTNSVFVFMTKKNSFKDRIMEFFKFVLVRAFTMVFEIVGFFVMFNLLGITDIISKPVVTFLVIVMNYFISKYFVFKNKV